MTAPLPCTACGGEREVQVRTGYRVTGSGMGDAEETWEKRDCTSCAGAGYRWCVVCGVHPAVKLDAGRNAVCPACDFASWPDAMAEAHRRVSEVAWLVVEAPAHQREERLLALRGALLRERRAVEVSHAG